MLESSVCEWQPPARYYNSHPMHSAAPGRPYYPHQYNMGYPHPGYQATPSHIHPHTHPHPHQMQMHHNSGMYAPNAALMESFITSSSTRLARNFAEKQRRTKLNTYIDELRSLVPMVSSSVAARSGKKVDKTSILRLAATYLRMHEILYGNKAQLPTLPPELHDFNWSQFLLHDIDGILLLITSAGKIVFISHTIDKVLGHNQTELFGQSLYSFTCPEDHDELRRNLSPDLDPANLNPTPVLNNGSSYGELSGDEAESCASASSSPRSSSSSSTSLPRLATSTERQRRSFYLRLRQKGCSRSEKPQYELVHVVGHLRITRRTEEASPAAGSGVVSRRSRKPREMNMSSNDVVLVAVIKPFKERRLTELSLIESTREEYITRHLKDGRIIYCDHRISFVSGYLSTEISGLSGFMFMHKEDMKWAMIALRQMYIKNESYGTSCYRLVDKTGKFFYIKTHGYLEFDPYEQASDDYIPSFICINTLISETEGEAAIKSMRQRFTPLIESKGDTGTLAIAESLSHDKSSRSSVESSPPLPSTPANSLSDPDELKICTKSLISNFPPMGSKPVSCSSPGLMGDDSQYYKLVVAAKAMPPVSVLTAKMGLKTKSSISPPSSNNHHRKEEVLNAPVQNRPSVLRGPIRASERSAVITTTTKRPRDEDLYIDSEICDKKARSSYEGSGVLVSPQSSSSVSSFCQSPIEPVSTTDDLNVANNSNSTYLNLDMPDGMEMRNIIEAPSFIVDEESEEELKRTPVHSSEMFQLWEEAQLSEDISTLDKSSLRLPGLEFSSLNMNMSSMKQSLHHHKSPNNGGNAPSILKSLDGRQHTFPR